MSALFIHQASSCIMIWLHLLFFSLQSRISRTRSILEWISFTQSLLLQLLFLQRPLRGHKPNTGRLYEAFLSILQGVTLEKEMSTLRFRMGMAEAENASLRGKIRTIEAIETVTRSQERRTRREMKRQLASVQ
ncbi:hypothetical protein Tco_1146688 [Tanacetum coccineum]